MGLHSAKANKGKNYQSWHSSAPDISTDSRQQHRQRRRDLSWNLFSHENVLTDEKGIVPRKVRRDISIVRFRKSWENRTKESPKP